MTTDQIRAAARAYPAQASFRYRQLPGSTPMVLLHGLGGDLDQLADLPWGQDFGERTVLAPDQRGHGRSTAPTAGPPTFDLLAHDVLALTESLGLRDRMVLVGVSMGAGVALRTALTAPDRVAGLVLIRPAWEHEAHPAHLRAFGVLADYLDGEDPAAGRTRFADSASYREVSARFPEAAQSLLAEFDVLQPRRVAAMLRDMPASAPYAAPGDPARLRCPSLVVGNHDDPFHPYELAQRWAAAIPTARLADVPPRYTAATEHRAALVDVVTGFLASIDGEPSS